MGSMPERSARARADCMYSVTPLPDSVTMAWASDFFCRSERVARMCTGTPGQCYSLGRSLIDPVASGSLSRNHPVAGGSGQDGDPGAERAPCLGEPEVRRVVQVRQTVQPRHG